MKNIKFIFWLGLGLFIFSMSCTPQMMSELFYNHTFPTDQYGNQVIVKNYSCTLVDGSGNTIIPHGKYIYIKPLNYDKSCGRVLYKAETMRGIDLYDGKGALVSSGGTTSFYGCNEGLISVKKGDVVGVIDTKGKEIIPFDYDYITIEKDELFITTKNKKIGVINTDNETIVPFIYDKIDVVNEDSIYVYTGERDSIFWGSRESYELDAYFNGKLTNNVERYPKVASSDDSEKYHIVEQMPRFPGCEGNEGTDEEKKLCAEKKMLEYIYTKIKYPTLARYHEIQGMVVVQFIVEKDGSITGQKIIRDVKAGCGDEALGIVNSMPQWMPGYQRDKPVRVQFNLPVKFKLE